MIVAGEAAVTPQSLPSQRDTPGGIAFVRERQRPSRFATSALSASSSTGFRLYQVTP